MDLSQGVDLGAAKDAQRQQQAAMQQAILAAMRSPHQVTEVLISGSQVVDATDGGKVLIVGKLDGTQIRIHMNRQTAQANAAKLAAGAPEATVGPLTSAPSPDKMVETTGE